MALHAYVHKSPQYYSFVQKPNPPDASLSLFMLLHPSNRSPIHLQATLPNAIVKHRHRINDNHIITTNIFTITHRLTTRTFFQQLLHHNVNDKDHQRSHTEQPERHTAAQPIDQIAADETAGRNPDSLEHGTDQTLFAKNRSGRNETHPLFTEYTKHSCDYHASPATWTPCPVAPQCSHTRPSSQ